MAAGVRWDRDRPCFEPAGIRFLSPKAGMSTPISAAPAGEQAPLPLVSGSLLFLVSVVGLFLELMLIRWIGCELPIFGFLQNAVLVVCFLGIGLGCWTCRQPFRLRDILMPLLLLVLLLAVIVTLLGLGKYSPIVAFFAWGQTQSLGEWLGPEPGPVLFWMGLEVLLLFGVLLLIWDLFVPIGRLLGRLMDDHPHTIQAYSINIAGSLAGIWLFVLLSVFYLPPFAWLAVVAVLLALLFWCLNLLHVVDGLLLAAILGLGWLASRPPGALETYWSPYQKLTLELPDEKDRYGRVGEYIVKVNNGPYQGLLDLSAERVRQRPELFPPELHGLSQYDIPLLLQPRPQNVLIVGAGTGNDVAGARRGGAQHITAVDIDQAIIWMGVAHHPERPYRDDGVVTIVNDDARSFFARSNDKYDLIIFGLLDAPLQSGTANVHLDNYVYTAESLQRARALLAKDGVLVLTFEILRPFIPERMAGALTTVFGHFPTYFYIPTTAYGWGGVMFVMAEDQRRVTATIAANARLATQVARWQKDYVIPQTGAVTPISDDWPYLYLPGPSIPLPYFGFALALLLLFWRALRQLQTPGLLRDRDPAHWHFFFLGAAFMLLEVQNISKAALVLGSTWWVNAVIISGILALILLANLLAALFPRLPLGPVYFLVCASSLALYFLDLSWFAAWSYGAKAAVVGLLTSLPMLFSGIIFIRSFAAVAGKDTALGANLLGALVGGLLQTVTFVTGIKALLLIVAALYLAAFLTRPKAVQQAAVPACLEPSVA